jgi:D-methionine transport system substrate-binding protein
MSQVITAPEIEVKKARKKWPWIVGGVAVVAIIATAIIVPLTTAKSATVYDAKVTMGLNPLLVPAEKITKYVAEEIAPELGLTIEFVQIDDFDAINRAVETGEVAVGYSNTGPSFADVLAATDYNQVSVAEVGQWTAGLFSKTYDSVDDIADGAKVGIRDDTSGQARGLLVLSDLGVITLADDAGDQPQISDIVDNPHNLQFVQVALGALGRSYEEVDLIAGYYADVAAVVPATDIIGIGDVYEGWGLQLVVNADHENDPGIKKLVEAFTDPRVTEFIENNDDDAFRIVLGQQELGPVPQP